LFNKDMPLYLFFQDFGRFYELFSRNDYSSTPDDYTDINAQANERPSAARSSDRSVCSLFSSRVSTNCHSCRPTGDKEPSEPRSTSAETDDRTRVNKRYCDS
jgi:hypothetical protein